MHNTVDIYWLAVNIYFEARGEVFDGKVAVAHTTLNRSRIKKRPIKNIIFEKKQFSWTIEHGANTKAKFVKDLDTFSVCWKAAQVAMFEQEVGYTFKNTTHFFNPDLAAPSWRWNMKFITSIGNHDFFHDPTYT